MYYYEVWVASQSYHSDRPLTYSSDTSLSPGMLVTVPLQRQKVRALVTKQVQEPSFKTKAIVDVLTVQPLPQEFIQLTPWLQSYYPAPFGQIMGLMIPSFPSPKAESPITKQEPGMEPPPLTKEQTEAVDQIAKHSPKSVLLHGDTGSGKTRVYIELTTRALSRGKSVTVLTPEIGLTPQLTKSFEQAFPGRVITIHSNLKPSERRDAWWTILQSKEPMIVIGPRSALFSPLKSVGLIIVDEFHDNAYKQEQAPHYLTTRVAAKLASLHKAQLILGSATPPVNDYSVFELKGLPIVRMSQSALGNTQEKPAVIIEDLKDRTKFSRSPWLSNTLLSAIETALSNGEQALVFLNRRGTARLVLCQICGWQAFCPRCDLPLTYHGDTHIMRCHTCGHSETTVSSCPECGAHDITFKSIGTKSLVDDLQRILPHARIGRFDSDTTKKESLQEQYASVKEGGVDILVGTQMLGKGLDLPKLTVVGIVTAETSLSFPDFTAQERTYQLLTQAFGRVNRGHLPGTAIVQTYHPESQLLKAAANQDYTAFYTPELKEREQFGFPPFRYLLKLTCTRASSKSAEQASTKLAAELHRSGLKIEVIGPSPAFTEKIQGKYRWQIVVKAVNRSVLVDIIKKLPANWSHDIDPMNLL